MEKNPNRDRLEALKLLPDKVVQQMTREELHAFLYEDEWPDSLKEKLKDYLEDIK